MTTAVRSAFSDTIGNYVPWVVRPRARHPGRLAHRARDEYPSAEEVMLVVQSLQPPSWFVVLPDRGCAVATTRLRPWARHAIVHPSGRPWILGTGLGRCVLGTAGRTRLAILGQHGVTSSEAETAAARIRSLADLDHIVSRVAGSFHLVATVAGTVAVQGSLTNLRRVFHVRIDGVTVAADRADVLVGLIGAHLDEEALLLHLLDSRMLFPLVDRPVWRGVSALPTDRRLVVRPDGSCASPRWWSPPEPTARMAEGAPALRRALSDAVEVRARGRRVLSSDLGGLDSTSVLCLAASAAPRVVAITADGRDPTGEDTRWARRTVLVLPSVEHHVIPSGEMPLVYEAMLADDHPLDEPSATAVGRERVRALTARAAAHGSTLHLTGFGGDELMAGSPAHLADVLRRQPRRALRDLRAYAIQREWSLREALGSLLDQRNYASWLGAIADDLVAPRRSERPALHWGVVPRLPPWATADAVATARDLLRAAARDAAPLGRTRGQHNELTAVLSISREVRHLAAAAARTGAELAAPFYDDRVVEVALAVRPEDRVTPWRYKPLLVEAMRGIVPAETLTRRTKDEGSYEVDLGLAHHRADVLALCDGSRLAALGLVDERRLREICERPLPPELGFDALYATLGCEAWLRTAGAEPDVEPKGGHHVGAIA